MFGNDGVKSYAKIAILMYGEMTLSDIEDALVRSGYEVNVCGPVTTNTELLFEIRRKPVNTDDQLSQDS